MVDQLFVREEEGRGGGGDQMSGIPCLLEGDRRGCNEALREGERPEIPNPPT